jgi:hypothetical protein
MMGDSVKSLTHLRNALEEGYAEKGQLLNDPHLDLLRRSPGFLEAIAEYFKGEINPQQARYRVFLNSFPDMDSVFSIDQKNASRYSLAHALSYDFSAFIPGMEEPGSFSRNVSSEYVAVCKRRLSTEYTLVVYSSVLAISDTLPPVETYFATYDSTGTQVAKQLFASYESENITTGLFNNNNVLMITEYHEEWKEDPNQNGVLGNEIVKEDVIDRKYFKIGKKGEFTEQGVPGEVTTRK